MLERRVPEGTSGSPDTVFATFRTLEFLIVVNLPFTLPNVPFQYRTITTECGPLENHS